MTPQLRNEKIGFYDSQSQDISGYKSSATIMKDNKKYKGDIPKTGASCTRVRRYR